MRNYATLRDAVSSPSLFKSLKAEYLTLDYEGRKAFWRKYHTCKHDCERVFGIISPDHAAFGKSKVVSIYGQK